MQMKEGIVLKRVLVSCILYLQVYTTLTRLLHALYTPSHASFILYLDACALAIRSALDY
jgi:hypothetical protein